MYREGQNPLEIMMNTQVQVLSTDGRIFIGNYIIITIGILRGVDQTLNCVIENCVQRIYSLTSGVQFIDMGLQILRGDYVVMIGEMSLTIDNQLEFDNIQAAPIAPQS
ncbi:hypothetical protein pb186bvf_016215 [Paramecium bursaria]